MEFIRATYLFLLELIRLAVVYLKQIPIGITVSGHDVDLFTFLIGVLIMGVVIVGAVTLVRSPVNVATTNRRIRESEARSEARYQRHREERRQKGGR